MYDKEQVRQRFLEEVERLIKTGVCRSYAQVAEGAGLKSYHLSDVRNGRAEVSLLILANFVPSYRSHGVSYGYILEGKQEQPVVPFEALKKLQQSQEALAEIRQLLAHTGTLST